MRGAGGARPRHAARAFPDQPDAALSVGAARRVMSDPEMAGFGAPRSLQHDRLPAEHDLAGGATRGDALAVAASAVGYAGPREHRFIAHRRRADDIRLGPAAARAGC